MTSEANSTAGEAMSVRGPSRGGDLTSENGELDRWTSMGMSVEEATAWRDAWGQATNPYDVWQWRAAGFRPLEAKAWAAAGEGVGVALQWRSLGCNFSQAVLFHSRDTLRTWIARGITVKRACAWIKVAGVEDVMIANAWERLGCGPRRARKWRLVGDIVIAHDAAPWIELQCSPEDARRWLSIRGIDAPKDAKRWIGLGMSSLEAKSWDELLVAGLDDAMAWKGVGCDAREARKWIELGSGMFAAEVAAWKEAGFTPAKLRPWLEAFAQQGGLGWKVTPDFVAGWIFAGCAAKQARRCMQADLTPADVLRLSEQGVTAKDAPSVVGYERPIPSRGTNAPSFRRKSTIQTPACLVGSHFSCEERSTCGCACHCWHDEKRFDHRLQGPDACTNLPRLGRKLARSRHCRSNDAADHMRCRTSDRCECACHCWHGRR